MRLNDVDLLLQDDDTIPNSILHKNKSLIILNNNSLVWY